MPQEATLFRGCSGLRTRVDPVRLKADDNGIVPAASAVNVVLDETGRPSRRKGFRLALGLAGAHSFFGGRHGQHALVVAGDTLYRVAEDLGSVHALRTGLTAGARMRYVRVEGDVFFTNGHEKGRYSEKDGLAHDWTPQPTSRPYPSDWRIREEVPTGHLLGYHAGRIYIAAGNTLWFTEGHAYSWAVLSDNWIPFGSRIRMVASAGDGLFLSTSREIIHAAGADPRTFIFRTLADYPALEGSDDAVEGTRIGSGEIFGRVTIFKSAQGDCIAGPDGMFFNLTRDHVNLPAASFATGVVTEDGQYLALIEP